MKNKTDGTPAGMKNLCFGYNSYNNNEMSVKKKEIQGV